MSANHFSSSLRGLKLSPLVLALGMGLWVIFGTASGVSAIHSAAGQGASQCQDAADVMAALDRSRNGISLTCNLGMLSGGTAQ